MSLSTHNDHTYELDIDEPYIKVNRKTWRNKKKSSLKQPHEFLGQQSIIYASQIIVMWLYYLVMFFDIVVPLPKQIRPL